MEKTIVCDIILTERPLDKTRLPFFRYKTNLHIGKKMEFLQKTTSEINSTNYVVQMDALVHEERNMLKNRAGISCLK